MSDAAPASFDFFGKNKSNPETVVYMSTFPPRECGIATFTSDLVAAVDKQFSKALKSKILALDDSKAHIYNYSQKVQYSIYADDLDCFKESAQKINDDPSIRIVSIQHEFGLFGGKYGDYLLTFLEVLTKPVIVTFHSVLPEPDKKLKQVVEQISEKSQAIVVMTQSGIDILKKYYDLDCDLHLIPHGIPHITYEDQGRIKKKMNLGNKFILSSFGLLSSSKGYEYVIKALPDLVQENPDLLYIIVGTTHPVVRKHEGEKYRLYLESLVERYKLHDHVKFYNKYVDIQELIEYLKATDIYVCASQSPTQITSGTLSYALGCGRPVVSTAFTHAKDLVTKKCGRLVDFGSSQGFKKALGELLSKRSILNQMQENAYVSTRYMIWENVALSYGKLFSEYIDSPLSYLRTLPAINLKHIRRLTDKFGMIQFANHSAPDIDSGYTLDDNARALICMAVLYSRDKKQAHLSFIDTYFKVLQHTQSRDGKLYNYINKDKQLNKDKWIVDAHSRGLWALGNLVSIKSIPIKTRTQAKEMFDKAVGHIKNTDSPRAAAFTILGLAKYNQVYPDSKNIKLIKKLADFLYSCYEKYSSKDWKWFESIMSYSNGTLVEAVICAYEVTGDSKYKVLATGSLEFLINSTFENCLFMPVGQDGWYKKGGKKNYFDQQPIEADTTISALIKAYKVFGDIAYSRKIITAFNWFLGKNTLGQFVYNHTTGGCHDGVGPNSLNLNQGAESTLAYLHARLILESL